MSIEFYITSISPLQTYEKGLRFELKGKVPKRDALVRVWGGASSVKTRELYQSIKVGMTLMLQARVVSEQPYILATNEQLVVDPTIDKTIFGEIEHVDVQKYLALVEKLQDLVTDKDYAQTLASFFDDSVFLKAFTQASATQTRQYNYTGGLLVHTVHVAKLALALTKVYPHLKSDLLLTSALLHDVGKIYDSQSHQTLLQGHLMQTYSLVHERTKSMVEEKRNALLHCILAHHGKKEWGSPVNPMIPEAFALHALDKMDMQIPAVIQAIQGQELTSEFHKDLGVLFKF